MYVPAFGKLETKNKDELLKVIRSVKQRLGSLRNKMEHPDYNNIDVIVSPSDLVVYKCERDYLNLAITKYISLGGEYKESALSIKGTKFNDRLEHIAKLTFIKGGFFSGNFKTVIDFTKGKPIVLAGTFNDLYEQEIEIDKEEFLSRLSELHIGEWLCHYSSRRFGIEVLDGEQWVLKFEYKDGKKKTFSGDNAYPYNYNEFLELLDM